MWERIWTRSIGGKIVVILLAVVVLNSALDAVLQHTRIESGYGTLEKEAALEDVERASSIVQDEVDDLSEVGMRWAHHDDTLRFVTDGDADFVRANLGDWTLGKASIDLLFICDSEGLVRWGRVEDPRTGEVVSVREFPGEALHRAHPMMLPMRGEDAGRIAGLMAVDDRPMLVSSHEILDSRGEGESTGRLIVGRFLDGAYLEELGRRARVAFRVWPLEGELPEDVTRLRDRITGRLPGEVVHEESAETLATYTTLNTVLDQPELILRAELPRELTARGKASARFALVSSLSSAFLILLVMLHLLQRIVIRPLSQLTRHAVEIGKTDDTTRRIGMERGDEIGSLSSEFDSMVDKLARSREELVRTARRAGMSEIATGILHNVGNVLNSVNVSASLLSRKVAGLSGSDLGRIVEVLEENGDRLGEFITEDPRGRHLLPFLRELSESLTSEQADVAEELRNLSAGIEHIAELVRSQQSYAGTKGVFEHAQLTDEVEAAIKISGLASIAQDDIELVREFEDLPSVMVDKHKLMEILVNLVQNAFDAVRQVEGGACGGRVTVRIRDVDGSARIEVSDTGVGIDTENLAKVFHHGFTTKPDGHGFGLHVSANAATEMNAKLTVHSEGPGTGATFALQIPLRHAEPAAAA